MYSYPCSHHTPSKLRGSVLGAAEPAGAGPAPSSGGVSANVGSPLLFNVLGAGGAAAAIETVARSAATLLVTPRRPLFASTDLHMNAPYLPSAYELVLG